MSEVDVEKGKVLMDRITGTIKGGVPFILKSDGDDATFDIPLAESSEIVPADNLLIGTLAPTFVAQTSDEYTNFAYSKSNKCFVKLSDAGNTVPANRAYLPIDLSDAGVKSFSLSFEDDATGIESIGNETMRNGEHEKVVYNLAGQRVSVGSVLPKGLYIVNGKKVMVK